MRSVPFLSSSEKGERQRQMHVEDLEGYVQCFCLGAIALVICIDISFTLYCTSKTYICICKHQFLTTYIVQHMHSYIHHDIVLCWSLVIGNVGTRIVEYIGKYILLDLA